ncbi:MAG TPA: twin-arginine translocase subunit TatC, partial [Chthonomonadales bacterium]|nr:twin-arginine translocase subunit TatC [Chthonomonadales bacterium]
IIRSLLYMVVGAVLAYQFFSPLYGLLYRPLAAEMKRQNAKIVHLSTGDIPYLPHLAHAPTVADYNSLVDVVNRLRDHPTIAPPMSIVFHNFHEPFMVRLTISIIYGFVLVLPLVLWELGGFVTPALTPQERKPLKMLLPLSAILMVIGVLVAYFTMFFAMHWFLSYLSDFPQPAVLMQDPNDYILFFVKMMGAFGIAFQLPVVIMGGAYVGLITSGGLIKQWRWGVVIAVAGGLFTPSNDIFSMALMSIPLLLLYGLSILLVRFVERLKARSSPA